MSQSGLIVRREEGKAIPDAFLELIVQNYPKGWGSSFVDDTGVKVAKGEDTNIDDIKTTLEELNDFDLTFSFVNADAALNLDDVSPYIILGDADNPQMLGFVNGDFPGYAKEKSSHPPEFFWINEFLIPEIQSAFDLAEDGDKLWAFLKKAAFKNKVEKSAVGNFTLTLVAGNGEALTFHKGEGSMQYDWGWVSNTMNYGKAKEPAAEEASDKPKSMFSARPGKSRSTVREAAPQAQATDAGGTKVTKPDTKAAGGEAAKNYSVRKERPGTHLTRQDKKSWYKARLNYTPRGWESCIEVEVYVGPDGKTLMHSQVKALGLKAMGLPKLNNPEFEKDISSPSVDPNKVLPAEKELGTTTKMLPVITPAAREEFKKYCQADAVKKQIAENGDSVSDPKSVQAMEEKIASFPKQLGYESWEDIPALLVQQWVEFAGLRKDFAGVMIWHLLNQARKKPEAAPTPVTETEKQELARDELVPEKKSMFSSRPKRATG